MTEIPSDRDEAQGGRGGEKPKLVDVRESIRYRRRAQEAESRCEALEAELAELRESRAAQERSVETGLAEERRKRESLEERLQTLETERRLEREFVRAGARDSETALLVARERMATLGEGDLDVEKLAQDVLEEKPYLKACERGELPPLGRTSRGVRPASRGEKDRADRLASRARTSGQRADLAAYMRARRNTRKP